MNQPLTMESLKALASCPTPVEFKPFQKMARLSRECIITEKLDGTNAQIMITEDGQFLTGSRNRWITPDDDNFGFSRWAHEHRDELMKLGPGQHFGEWYGQGIQRGYGLTEKRFALFNARRWTPFGVTAPPKTQHAPQCCHVVPILYQGVFSTETVDQVLDLLRHRGSCAVPGFMRPEGVIVFHVAAGVSFKKTIENDEQPKSLVQ